MSISTYSHSLLALVDHGESEVVHFWITEALKILQGLVNDDAKSVPKQLVFAIFFLLDHFEEWLVVTEGRGVGGNDM